MPHQAITIMPKQFNHKMYLQILGATLRSYRLARKIDINAVAREVKISPAELNLVENGKKDLYAEQIVSLCLFYQEDPEELFLRFQDMDDPIA